MQEVKVKLRNRKVYKNYDLIETHEEHTAIIPVRATEGAAAYDLHYFGDDVEVKSNSVFLASTGVSIEMPENLCGLILPRSGLALTHRITILNSPGLIDPDYVGEIKVMLYNWGWAPFLLKNGMRIAQLLFVEHHKVNFVKSDSLKDTARGSGGFGSTGI